MTNETQKEKKLSLTCWQLFSFALRFCGFAQEAMVDKASRSCRSAATPFFFFFLALPAFLWLPVFLSDLIRKLDRDQEEIKDLCGQRGAWKNYSRVRIIILVADVWNKAIRPDEGKQRKNTYIFVPYWSLIMPLSVRIIDRTPLISSETTKRIKSLQGNFLRVHLHRRSSLLTFPLNLAATIQPANKSINKHCRPTRNETIGSLF